MLEELIDRFGELPKSVENLLFIAKIKTMAHRVFFTEIAQKNNTLKFTLYEKAKINPAKIPDFVAAYDGRMTFAMDKKAPYFIYQLKANSRDKKVNIKELLEKILQDARVLLETSNDTCS